MTVDPFPPPGDPFDGVPNPTPRELAWHPGRFALPPDWEVYAFVKNPAKGSINFQTRRGLAAILSWRTVPGRPDLARMMNEVHRRALAERAENATRALRDIAKDKQADALRQAKIAEAARQADAARDRFKELTFDRIGRFLIGVHRPEEPVQATAYIEGTDRLVEWLFPVDDPVARRDLWWPLLRSFQTNDGAVRRWALFGVTANLPDSFKITDVAAYPGNVVLQFDGPGHLGVNLRRWALPSHLTDGRPLSAYYKGVLRQLRNRVVGVEDRPVRSPDGRDAWPSALVDYERQGEITMDKLVGRFWTGQGLIWEHPEERRLYAVEQFGPSKTERLDFRDIAFRPLP